MPFQGHGRDAAPAGQAEKRQLLWSLAGAAPSEQGDADAVPGFCKCRAAGQLQRPKGLQIAKDAPAAWTPVFLGVLRGAAPKSAFAYFFLTEKVGRAGARLPFS